MIWVIVFGIGLLLSLRLTYLKVNLFSVKETTITTKWLNFWNTTSLDAKLPIAMALFSLSWIARRLSYYCITVLTKSDDQLPYMKLIRFCNGSSQTLGASVPILFSSKLAAITVFSPQERSNLWLGTKLWIIIVAVICSTLEQLSSFNNNDAALVNDSYTSWSLFCVAWQFYMCAVISLLRVRQLKNFFASESPVNQHGSAQKSGYNDTLIIIKRMERQALTFILTGAVLTLHVVFNMHLRPGAIVKFANVFCEFKSVVNQDIVTFICAFFLFLYLYLNWPKGDWFNRNGKGKKVAPEKTKKDEISSIQSEGNVEEKKTERAGD